MVNTDYSASAVKMVAEAPSQLNRLEQLALLNHGAEIAIQELDETPQAKTLKDLQVAITALKAEIKADIDVVGSYQNTEKGWYAVKQERVSVIYSPELVKQNLPKFATALIEEAVNSKALDGLVKGKLVTDEQVKSVIGDTKKTYAYIIQAGK